MCIGRFLQILLMASLLGSAPLLADDFKIIKLEQDVRNLERQVADLTRQLNSLSRPGDPAPMLPRAAAAPASTGENTLWLQSANWTRIRLGMNELDVIQILGKPTSMRGDAASASRTLLYATEIGSSGFLGGNVELHDRRVIAINQPTLK